MYYISDYRKQAIDKIIPYLIEFPQIVSIIENSADRYQAIENVIWNIANNFKVDDARGVFLQALAHNENTKIVYTDKAKDAFTYGTKEPIYQAYGTGHYYSQSSYISGIKRDLTDEKTIRAVKAKIIQNNTNAKIEDVIECLKLYFNATNIKIYESNPMNISLMLVGKNLEISSSGNRDVIKNVLAGGVGLKDIYINQHTFDIFQYDEFSSYSDNRYPILIGETTDIYKYISQSVTLDSEFEDHIKTNHENFAENQYACTVGAFKKLTPNSVLFSSVDNENTQKISLEIDNNNMFVVNYNDNIYTSTIEAKLDTRYTIIISNNSNSFKVWILNNIYIYGKDVNQDTSFIINRVKNSTPDINIEDYTTINAPIYINCKNIDNTPSSFGDFTYYAILFGDIENIDKKITEYYISCYGEKQILFNCFENKNHLYINTQNPLISNIMTTQSYFNYKDSHSNGKYLYMDGKSGINYFLSDTPIQCEINNLDISFDVCMPIEISTGYILTDFISDKETESKIYFNNEGKLYIDIPIEIKTQREDEDGNIIEEIKNVIATYGFEEPVISVGEYATFRISIQNNTVYIFKNNKFIFSVQKDGTIKNIPTTLRVAYDKNISNPYKGFIKNLKLSIIGIDENDTEHNINIDLPYKSRLIDTDKKYDYINYGARFITTPQLITDKQNTDLYGNILMGKR